MTGSSQANTVASTEAIRAHFPALKRLHNHQPVAYFDGPGGTQVPRGVIDAMTDYLAHHNANTHWSFPSSQETDRAIAEARRAVADFLGATPEEIAFGSNMTTLTYHLARSLGRGFGPGDEILLTELDHHANIDPWRELVKERGVTIRSARLNPETGQTDLADLEAQITDRTRLVAIGAASNALGTITDIAHVTTLAHSAGSLVLVDAVHYAPHRLVDVTKLGCDFLACSAYKFHGPHIGVLFGKRDRIEALELPRLKPSPNTSPERLETGTQNHEGIVGAAAAVDFLASLAPGESRRSRLEAAFESIHGRTQSLIEHLWDEFTSIDGLTIFGPPLSQPRTPTISFALRDIPSVEVARKLAEVGLFVSHGDFYATTAVERLGRSRDGLVRIGCACYTTPDEIDRLIQGVRRIAHA